MSQKVWGLASLNWETGALEEAGLWRIGRRYRKANGSTDRDMKILSKESGGSQTTEEELPIGRLWRLMP
jgi:hypothetical protein